MRLPTRRINRRDLVLAAAAALAGTVSLPSRAADEASAYPTRPVTIVVPYAPGGGTDIVARLVASELAKRWKTGVVVENKPGAGGQIGNNLVAKAKPDGYTLLLGITVLIQSPKLYKNLPYDVFKDFTPLAQLATSVNFLAVPTASPASSVKDFVALAKARQGTLNFGSNGNAGTSHLDGALLNSIYKLDMTHVPYSGSGPLLTAMMGQQVDLAFIDIASVRPYVVSGKLKVLASTGVKRSSAFPNVPTLAELGINGFEPVGWFSLFAPANVAEPIRKAIGGAVAEIVQAPEVQKRLDELGLTPAQLSPEAFALSMREDKLKWEKMIDAGNVTVE